MNRYSIINDKNPREIVLLRGSGCKWRRCTFCDYHLDFSTNIKENYNINIEVLDKVTGIYGKLEVINSGSFVDLDEDTIEYIVKTMKKCNIKEIHFECHWMHRFEIKDIRDRFSKENIIVKVKIGVETFNREHRENILDKGINEENPKEISKGFDEVCLLQGIANQTKESMINDIETGLQYFERVCVNIMIENSKPIKPDLGVRKIFIEEVYPIYKNNKRVDILLNNTDFGVGGNEDE